MNMKKDPTKQLMKPRSQTTLQQKKMFAKHYVEHWSVSGATAFAGITHPNATALLKSDPVVKNIISKHVTKKLAGMEVDNQKILAKFVEIAFHPDPEAAKIKISDQLRALEMLGKASGLFDQQEDKDKLIPKVEVVITSEKQQMEQKGLVAPAQPLRIN